MAKTRQVTTDGGSRVARRRGTCSWLADVRRDDGNGRYNLRPLTRKAAKERLLQKRKRMSRVLKVNGSVLQVTVTFAVDEVTATIARPQGGSSPSSAEHVKRAVQLQSVDRRERCPCRVPTGEQCTAASRRAMPGRRASV